MLNRNCAAANDLVLTRSVTSASRVAWRTRNSLDDDAMVWRFFVTASVTDLVSGAGMGKHDHDRGVVYPPSLLTCVAAMRQNK